jgi:hypothetical protein
VPQIIGRLTSVNKPRQIASDIVIEFCSKNGELAVSSASTGAAIWYDIVRFWLLYAGHTDLEKR